MKKFRILLAGMAATMFGLVAMPLVAHAATTVVSPANMHGWAFINDQSNAAEAGTFVNGPGTPPLGSGSAQLTATTSADGHILTKAAYQGVKFADFTALKYSTYRTSGDPALAIALQFNIDSDLTDSTTTYQGRIVYEPYHTQTVTTGVWQNWDAMNDAAGTGTGNWWFSNGTIATATGCTQANPCTWAEVKTALPNGGVHNTYGAVVLKAGSGWTGFSGNVDALKINSDVYNFELTEQTIKVTIDKFLDGKQATATSANNSTFPMASSWSADNIGAGSGTYGLAPTGFNSPNPYEAVTSDMSLGANYATNEVTSGSTVASSCTANGAPYALVGYKTGDTLAHAESATTSSTSPAFTNLQKNMYVLVMNKSCATPQTYADCKNDGWKNFHNPEFKNEKKCKEFVEDHAHKAKGDVKFDAYGLLRRAQFNVNTADNGGWYRYSDANKDWYKAKISTVKVSGNTAWFAGVVTESKSTHPEWVGNWVFVKVVDNSPDKIWGSFTTETLAKAGVQAMSDPGDGPFNVTKGNLKVKNL